ncbi:hypothetical protein [Pseudomonas asiatica]|uniref:hypothetical protein n=1 Tax=Pseudomonas asiatica TaxID=2219225 RepID=UPI003877D494
MNRLKLKVLGLSALLLICGAAQADEVLAEADDNTAGKSIGTLTGVMLGGAAGGPVGALAGAGLGWLAGWAIQSGTGMSETAYAVREDGGSTVVVRSPVQRFAIGDQVEQRGGRLHPLDHRPTWD